MIRPPFDPELERSKVATAWLRDQFNAFAKQRGRPDVVAQSLDHVKGPLDIGIFLPKIVSPVCRVEAKHKKGYHYHGLFDFPFTTTAILAAVDNRPDFQAVDFYVLIAQNLSGAVSWRSTAASRQRLIIRKRNDSDRGGDLREYWECPVTDLTEMFAPVRFVIDAAEQLELFQNHPVDRKKWEPMP